MFNEILREIAEKLPDIHCILLMGMDGLPIEKITNSQEASIESISAEFTALLRVTNQTAHEVEAGTLDEVVVISDKLIVLMKAITGEYFLMMVLPQDTNLGRARFELKKAKYALEKEFV